MKRDSSSIKESIANNTKLEEHEEEPEDQVIINDESKEEERDFIFPSPMNPDPEEELEKTLSCWVPLGITLEQCLESLATDENLPHETLLSYLQFKECIDDIRRPLRRNKNGNLVLKRKEKGKYTLIPFLTLKDGRGWDEFFKKNTHVQLVWASGDHETSVDECNKEETWQLRDDLVLRIKHESHQKKLYEFRFPIHGVSNFVVGHESISEQSSLSDFLEKNPPFYRLSELQQMLKEEGQRKRKMDGMETHNKRKGTSVHRIKSWIGSNVCLLLDFSTKGNGNFLIKVKMKDCPPESWYLLGVITPNGDFQQTDNEPKPVLDQFLEIETSHKGAHAVIVMLLFKRGDKWEICDKTEGYVTVIDEEIIRVQPRMEMMEYLGRHHGDQIVTKYFQSLCKSPNDEQPPLSINYRKIGENGTRFIFDDHGKVEFSDVVIQNTEGDIRAKHNDHASKQTWKEIIACGSQVVFIVKLKEGDVVVRTFTVET